MPLADALGAGRGTLLHTPGAVRRAGAFLIPPELRIQRQQLTFLGLVHKFPSASVKFCFAELKLFQFAFDVLDNDRTIYCIFTHNLSPPLYIVPNFAKILS